MADVIVSEPLGMVALRGDLGDERLAAAVMAVAGVGVPDRLRIEGTSGSGAAWMSPDELLLFVPRDGVTAALTHFEVALAGTHHLALDVSDLRACIRLNGPAAREVLAKLSPADLHPNAFGPGVFRRTHLGQVAAAMWLEGEGARILCFGSVGHYALALLRQSAADGAVGFF